MKKKMKIKYFTSNNNYCHKQIYIHKQKVIDALTLDQCQES